MKKNWTKALALAALATLAGCADGGADSTISACKANTCIDDNTLSICAGGIEVSQISCPSGCSDGACSTGCTSNTCMDSSILMVCVNGTVTPTPCPYGCDSNTNTCKTLDSAICTDGAKKCENNKAYVCANNSWGDGADCGANGCNTSTNECNAPAVVTCTDGAKKCENNKAYVCANNSWGDGADCGANGCNTSTNECNAPASVTCTDGDKKCENNKAYVCSNNSWGDGADCGTDGCNTSTNECNAPAVVTCNDGDKKCENNKAYVCANNSWGDGADCGADGCNTSTNECNAPAVVTCNDGDKKCENNKAYVCSNNSWGDGADCGTDGCNTSTNECNAPAVVTCNDGDKKCENNKAYVCSNNSWGDGADCGTDGCNTSTNECNAPASVTCTDGDKKCENNKAYVCSNNSWGDGADCGTDGCNTSTNECNAPAVVTCNDGDKKCENNKAYVCANNSWGDGADCGADGCNTSTNECNAPAVVTCSDGDKQCSGNDLQVCVSGNWSTYACPYGCENNACKSAPTCTNGAKQCVSGNAQTCDNGVWKTQICDYGCNGGVCTVPTCTNGATQCSGNYVQTCTNGNWVSAAAACSKGCENGACKPDNNLPAEGSPCTEDDQQICTGGNLYYCSSNTWKSYACSGEDKKCDTLANGTQECVYNIYTDYCTYEGEQLPVGMCVAYDNMYVLDYLRCAKNQAGKYVNVESIALDICYGDYALYCDDNGQMTNASCPSCEFDEDYLEVSYCASDDDDTLYDCSSETYQGYTLSQICTLQGRDPVALCVGCNEEDFWCVTSAQAEQVIGASAYDVTGQDVCSTTTDNGYFYCGDYSSNGQKLSDICAASVAICNDQYLECAKTCTTVGATGTACDEFSDGFYSYPTVCADVDGYKVMLDASTSEDDYTACRRSCNAAGTACR